jgi:hypothetical protein
MEEIGIEAFEAVAILDTLFSGRFLELEVGEGDYWVGY